MLKNKIVIIAGESSGDYYAYLLVKNLILWNPDLQISGMGGKKLLSIKTIKIIRNLSKYSVTGIYEVLKNLHFLKKSFKEMKNHLYAVKPNILILVDFPYFNFRIAKFAKKFIKNIRIIYYISPQIWAWKKNRIYFIKKYIDIMAVLFAFEKDIYTNANIPVSFVGHPLKKSFLQYKQSIKTFNFPKNKKHIIALLPGSRNNEIEKIMPVFAQTITFLNSKIKNLLFIIPIANTINFKKIISYTNNHENVIFTFEKSIEVIICSNCVIVASGTASLECALLKKPMCIVYKTSFLTYILARMVLKIKYIGICNIIENKIIVPELLQYNLSVKNLSKMIISLLFKKKLINNIKKNLHLFKKSFFNRQKDCTIDDLIKKELYLKNKIL